MYILKTFSNGQFQNMLTAEIAHSYSNLMENLVMDHVMIYGMKEAPSRVVRTDYDTVMDATFTFDQDNMVRLHLIWLK